MADERSDRLARKAVPQSGCLVVGGRDDSSARPGERDPDDRILVAVHVGDPPARCRVPKANRVVWIHTAGDQARSVGTEGQGARVLDVAAQRGDQVAGSRVPQADMVFPFAVGSDPLAVGTDRQLINPVFVATHRPDRPARRRIVDADLTIQANDEPPAVRCERRGELDHGPIDDGDGPARRGIPQTNGLSIQRDDPLSIRTIDQTLDRSRMPGHDRHQASCRRLPEANGRVCRTRSEAFAVGTVSQGRYGALMPAQGEERSAVRHVPDAHGPIVDVRAGELLSRQDNDRKLPDAPCQRHPGHHGAGAVEQAVQVSPLPVAVLQRGRVEISPGGVAVLELQGRRGGREI